MKPETIIKYAVMTGVIYWLVSSAISPAPCISLGYYYQLTNYRSLISTGLAAGTAAVILFILTYRRGPK